MNRFYKDMAGKMKLFQTVQKCYGIMGILLPPKSFQNCSINARNLFFILSLTLTFFSTIAYFLFQARSLLDYGNSFYGSTSDLYTLADFLIAFWKMPTILKFIALCEKFIEQSK